MINKNIKAVVQAVTRLNSVQTYQIASTDKFLKNLDNTSQKLKLKQTVSDKSNLNRFLNTQVQDGKLYKNLQRTSFQDEQFKEFLKEYQQKHRDIPNIIDLSHYQRDQGLYSKTPEMRKEELIMLDEFRRRAQNKVVFTKSKSDFERRNEQQEEDEDDDNDEDDGADDNMQDQDEDLDPTSTDQKLLNRDLTFGEKIWNKDSFSILLIDRDVTTLTTKLNRVNHFRYLIFAGNANGVIGYGKGKGLDFEDALDKAIADVKRNLIAINIDENYSWPQKIHTRYNGFELIVEPRQTFNPWGHPTVAMMLALTGIDHCRFHCIYRNQNPYAMMYAYFKAMTQTRTPKQIAESEGVKVYRKNYGIPYWNGQHKYTIDL